MDWFICRGWCSRGSYNDAEVIGMLHAEQLRDVLWCGWKFVRAI